MLDPTGQVTSWNAGARRFKGYEADEIIGEHFSRFYTPEETTAGVPKRALETAEREGRFEAEGWRVRKDGTRFWANVVIDPIRDPAGALVGFAKVTRDLTERRAAEEALRRSEERFRLLVQSVTDYAIYMLDPDGARDQLECRRRALQGLCRRRDHRPALLALLHRRGPGKPAFRSARSRPPSAKAGSKPKAGGCARTARASGPAWSSIRSATTTGRLIGFAKVTRDLTERRSAAGARGGARRFLPVAEDGGDRPADRRRRPRLQQPAQRDHRQPRPRPAAARRRRRRHPPARQCDQGGASAARPHPAHARLRAPAGSQARDGRHRRIGPRHGRARPAHVGPGSQHRDPLPA